MSYILEALEKSENERKQRTVPDLHTQHTLYPGIKRSRQQRTQSTIRRYFPAVLITCGIIVSAWLFREHMPLELEIKIRQSTISDETVLTEENQFQEEQAPPSHESTAEIIPNTSLSQTASTPPEQLATVQLDANTSLNDSPPGAGSLDLENTEPETLITSSTKAKATVTRRAIILEPAPLLLSDDDVTVNSITPTPLPFLEELPSSVRNILPIMKFAGHTYSTTPEDRMIIINNSIRREGDPLDQGLRLEEITWDGIILNFREVRFQVVTTN